LSVFTVISDGKGFGLLPEREIQTIPFEECALDLLGPWEVKFRRERLEFNALAIIDTMSYLIELIQVRNRKSQHIASKYAQCWLSR